jgi:Uma2 family endonuclease
MVITTKQGGIIMPLPMENIEGNEYTVDYIYSLPDGVRAELIDGVVYDIAFPNTIHQILIGRLTSSLINHIDSKGGTCTVCPAPFAVFLKKDKKNYLEPDISVICDKDKLDERGCNGAPDFIIEIVSNSSKKLDYGIKCLKYRNSGVREYWIVNPSTRTVNVYDFEHDDENSDFYMFDDEITSCLFTDFTIRLADFI